MPRYFFRLHAGERIFRDEEGMDLTDPAAAHAHACEVARELMAHSEPARRHWTIVIHDAQETCFSEILFASVDRTLDHLEWRGREQIERLSDSLARAYTLVSNARRLTLRLEAIAGWRTGKPYFVMPSGSRT